jgi:hypothetical protein
VAAVVLWVVSVIAIAGLSVAQTRPEALPAPRVISGDEIGFRVEGFNGGMPTGRLVVRINGEWVETAFTIGTQRLTAR